MKRIVCGIAIALACAFALPGFAQPLPQSPMSFGFGVSVPYALPIDWASSYSFASFEALITPNLTFFLDVGTYPASFPDMFESGASILVRGWLGPTVLYAGGGVSMQWTRVGASWGMRPLLGLRAGYQIWILDSLAVSLQFRTMEAFPVTWTFAPEIALGFNLALGRGRPAAPQYDGDYLWILAGLGVAALVAFLPRR